MAGKKNYELEILISGGTDSSLAASIKRARGQLDSLERQANLSTKGISNAFGMSTKGIDALGNMSDKVFGTIVKGAGLAVAGVTAIATASTSIGMGFESQMSTVQAIGQASEADMKRLTAVAKEMGVTTQFTAEEAGQGLEYMASAGWSTQQMIDGLPGVMYMAAASGESLALSSDIVTGTLTAFGKEAGEAARLADVLAMASAATNTDVAGLGLALEYVAPVAGALAYSYEDVAIAIGMMSNANIKGEKAGTAMRTMLTNLAKPTDTMLGYMEDLGISLTDAEGNMIPLRQLLIDIREGFAGLTEAERAEYAAGIAGKEGMSGLLAIVNTAQDDFETLTERIDNSTGAAQEMAQVRIDNLAGDIELLKSAAEGTGIEIYDGISGELRSLVQMGTAGVDQLTEDLKENIPTIRRQVKEFGEDVKEGFAPLMDFGEWCLDNPNVIKSTLVGITAAMGTFKAAQTAKDGIALLGRLSTLVSAWPVAAAGLAVGGIAAVATAVHENYRKIRKDDLDKRFGSITLSMEELDETARMIVDNGNMDKVAESMEALGKVKELSESFEEANKDLERLNWKIGMGFDLSEADQQDYGAAIEQMVQNAVDLVQQSQFTAQVSVQALFGSESEAGNDLIAGFDSMYASINGEVSDLGRQLGEVYSSAVEDGVIDVDEMSVIQELQQKLANITSEVTQAQSQAKIDRIMRDFSGQDLTPDSFKNLQSQIGDVLDEQKEGAGEAFELTAANLNLQRQRGEISQADYDTKYQAAADQYDQSMMEMQGNALNYSISSIADAYQDEFNQVLPEIQSGIDAFTSNTIDTMLNGKDGQPFLDAVALQDAMGLNELDPVFMDNLGELWEEIQPDYEALAATAEKYRQAGKEIPEAVAAGLADAAVLGTLMNDNDAMWELIALQAGNNSEFQKALQAAQENGYAIPDGIAEHMEGNTQAIDTAVTALFNHTQAQLDRAFANLKVNGSVSVQLGLNSFTARQYQNRSGSGEVAHNARGGLIAEPTLSWFAEEGPEMAIPLDGSNRALSLWREAGQLLGAYESNNYSTMSQTLAEAGAGGAAPSASFAPVFSPVIYVGSENARQEVMSGLSAGYEQFKEMMERYQSERARVSF